MKKIFIALGLGGLAYGVYSYYMQQYQILENWKYRITGAFIKKLTPLNVEIQVDYEITNDSAISIVVTDYYFDLYLNGEKVGFIKNASINQRLEPNGGKSFFPMIFSIKTTAFLKGNVLLGLLDSVKESTLKQKGYFGVKKGILKFRNIPFEYTYKLKDFM